MFRLVYALVLVLLITTPSLGQQSLVGTYKMVSLVSDIGGTTIEPYGKAPRGYLVLTPTRLVAFYTGGNRKFGTSAADKAALFDTMGGWSGTYRIEGSKMIIAIEASWIEHWNGKDQIRNWELSGNRLTLKTNPQPYARDPSKTAVIQQVWEKVE